MPHHPEIVVKLPEESDCLLLLSAMVGREIRKRHGDEEARAYYNEARWAKTWAVLVAVVKGWVSVE